MRASSSGRRRWPSFVARQVRIDGDGLRRSRNATPGIGSRGGNRLAPQQPAAHTRLATVPDDEPVTDKARSPLSFVGLSTRKQCLTGPVMALDLYVTDPHSK